ncbi:class II fructose-bisphosphate aldolase [Schumannella luteola]|uniref:Fructose-bisphosphate aldolase class II n=1 Tax=Schumannella luteola TaxID=472059 RepID=A0A852YKI5_9MICO|nr:fructose-bisphosphate aldolase class II [Schumannella luteola]TPX06217.1 class II fructose-bisphosphate aldolase [Schumannella luteola]
MTLARTGDLVADAGARGGAVAAINAITLEHVEAIVAGAVEADRAVIVQLSENATLFHGGDPVPLLSAARALAAAAPVPVSLHLDHVQDAGLLARSLDVAASVGLSSVMVDAARLDYAANVAETAAFAARGHALDLGAVPFADAGPGGDAVDVGRAFASDGVAAAPDGGATASPSRPSASGATAASTGLFVEAELGEVGGKDGAHAPGVRTDPAEAAAFVAATGVDALAVAVGSSHAMTSRTAALDLGLIERLAAAVPVPLVLHGSSGVPDDLLVAAARAGIRKINVGTALNVVGTAALRAALAERPDAVDPRKPLAASRAAMTAEVARILTLLP